METDLKNIWEKILEDIKNSINIPKFIRVIRLNIRTDRRDLGVSSKTFANCNIMIYDQYEDCTCKYTRARTY